VRCCFGALILPRDRLGDLVNAGERSPGEHVVEYAAPIVDQFPVTPYSAEEIIAAHRMHNASRVAPAPRPAPFHHRRSLRRF
jgi:hypothetical protein